MYHGKFTIRQITCDFIVYTTMLDNLFVYKLVHNKHPHYQPVVDYTYWHVLGSFNNWNIIQLINKTTPSEYFDSVHKVGLYVTIDSTTSLVQSRKYGATNEMDTTTMGYYVIKYLSEPYTLQEVKTKYGQVSK